MPVQVSLDDLMAYTEWERDQWHGWFQQNRAHALMIDVGPHGDGRFDTVGDLVRHIFSAETRYIDRLSGRPLTDPASIPTDNVEALFNFGRQSRQRLRSFHAAFPAQSWDTPQELALGKHVLTATPRKIVLHILLHEAKHWAQVATLLRLHGLTGDFHDVLFSPILSGESAGHQAPA
jgi:uncharacterized damage-inducible protein DinB